MLKYLLDLFRRPSKRQLRELLLVVEEERVAALRQSIGWQERAERCQLQLRSSRARERALNRKIAIYEKAVLRVERALLNMQHNDLASVLRRAYDAPIVKEEEPCQT